MAELLPTTLSILDPFAGYGFDIAKRFDQESPHLRVLLFTTEEVQEHRLLAMAGQPAVVGPLEDLEALTESRVVVTCRRPARPWDERLMDWLRARPDIAWLDVSQPGIAGDQATLVVQPPRQLHETHTWIRLPDPGLAGPLAILEALAPLEPTEAHFTLLQPCSGHGDRGIEELAAQARARLSGETPPRAKALPAVLAFDLLPGLPSIRQDLRRQMAALHPALSTRIQVVQAGVFFGHTCLLELRCRKEVRATQLRKLLNTASCVHIVRDPERAMPSQVADTSKVLVWNPTAENNRVNLWVATDGELVFGAELALKTLAALATA